MRNMLLFVVRVVVFVVDVAPRIVLGLMGVGLLGIGFLMLLVDAHAATTGQPTFFALLMVMTRHIGLAPWYTTYLYCVPLFYGAVAILVASRMRAHPRRRRG